MPMRIMKYAEGEPLAALAAYGAYAVALGVDTPPLEVSRGPLWHHAGTAFAGEAAHFIKSFPGVLFLLQALHPLCAGLFLYWNRIRHF